MPWLQWLTRDEDIKKAKVAPYRLLEAAPELSAGDPQNPNMLIQGDNLEALKALLPYYAGRVKCIYIDPPFNTGAAFEHYDDNVEHSTYLSMLYPRLELLRDLMCTDGAIFVHLDDNEIDYLRVVMDEIFGRNNFLGRITIDARAPSAFSTVNPGVFKASEYLLWYAKDRTAFRENTVRVPRTPDPAYNQWLENPDDEYSKWRFRPLREVFEEAQKKNSTAKGTDKRFERFVIENAGRILRLAAISDTGAGKTTIEMKQKSLKQPDRVFRVDRAKHEPQFIYSGQQIVFYEKNVSVVDGVRTATRLLTNIWVDIAWEGIAGEGDVTFKKGKKPEKLIKRCLELATESNDLVLDSFLGSGTTAAVAHKMGRHYIGIELGEHATTHCVSRLKAVISGDETGISKAVRWKGGVASASTASARRCSTRRAASTRR
jgi:adenine-specific DNA-methyltransferase